jgi:hypothetical protein
MAARDRERDSVLGQAHAEDFISARGLRRAEHWGTRAPGHVSAAGKEEQVCTGGMPAPAFKYIEARTGRCS